MLGQEENVITGTVQGLIQDKVAALLQLRTKLQEMSRSPVLTISDKANQLLPVQTELENALTPTLEKAQSGDLIAIGEAGVYYYRMEKQITDVNDLYAEYTGLGSSAKASMIPGIPNWVLYAGGAFIVWRLIKRR
jgi:hypothetical protein